ncbi:uncharacterized protein FOMMEDRAFT_111168 [Fomitiporia mediterranea MF3/22]|uniref:uncharacterized protein n=1 Tax=Fomitiporia mediterranea (strain MF3/22) TaxID=694068 RepID=UPI0004409161|nr:uncharacterized protein FOMMEDRAFT_111168 [Fomitiporia mediterranea MF3/22]EJD01390.1 hypothetical protein FOMMEDRAFT_111168 [Fomitiporia mediterranea MF3/22]
MPVPALPTEIWREILDIAAQDDPILETSLVSPLAECSWYEMVFGEWWLRKPQEALRIRQRQSYALKKAFMETCVSFAQIGAEFMYRSILVGDPKRLRSLVEIFDRNTKLGWWVKAIYVYADERLGIHDLNVVGMDDCVISLVRHCPKLEVFIVDPQVAATPFLAIADALRTYCSSSLKLVQWKLAFNAQSKLVPAVIGMRHLVALQIDLSYPLEETSTTLPGVRQTLGVTFPHLRQLSLQGAIQDFVEQIALWEMPELTSLTLDFKLSRHDFPDIQEVLEPHASQLEMLNINAIPTLDVKSILGMCPNLTTFCFSLDWQLEGNLVVMPHKKIKTIGLYGLRHAFGVGFAGETARINPFEAVIIRRRNDMNFAAINKVNFPSLSIVKILEPGLLNDLNRNNGPAEGLCFERWERWWDQCANQRVRLEDCTGNPLGTLPQLPQGEEEEDGSDITDSVVDE